MPIVSGLSHKEAQERLIKYGPNEIKDSNRITPLKILVRQIRGNFIIYLLAISAVISFAVGKSETMYTLFAVVIVVVVFGFIQEYKAEQAVLALKNMLTQSSTVVREGKEQQLESRNLVPGDVVLLRTGEKIPADCAVVDAKSLLVNEAVLTGESREISKSICEHAEKCNQDNTIFMGSFVVGGHCMAQVMHTGMNTKFGKIASLISGAEKELTLEKQVNAIGKYTVLVGVIISVATGILMFGRNPSLDWVHVTDILILVVALSVSSFPEGLPVVLTTTLAVGAGRMAKQNAIVNRMGVIETLGETTVICSDKTGTITTGEMTVKKVFCGKNTINIEGAGYDINGQIITESQNQLKSYEFKHLILCSALCNDAKIKKSGDGGKFMLTGSPTEGALLVLAAKAGTYREDTDAIRLEEIPFSSERKIMSVLVEENRGNPILREFSIYVKGAPEEVLKRCTKLAVNGKEISLEPEEQNSIMALTKELAKDAYRTLALAYKNIDNVVSKNAAYQENELTFLGIVALEDPPRPEVFKALETAKKAGIDVKMITGDNIETAISIGAQIGLRGRATEGSDLDDLSDEELKNVVETISVFARVRPEHKIRIVRALKQLGHVVAMTGDGVNDAPALKEAHVGIAMGRNGTDVSRATADVTLRDDNFATIISAIKEGRAVFNNIQKFVAFQLACNLAELLILFIGVMLAPAFGWQVPIITAIQILFMNLVTDSIPAITLGFNPTSPDVMDAKPRSAKTILNRFTVKVIIFAGLLMSFFTLLANYFSINFWVQDAVSGTTTVTAGLICLEIVSAFTFRSFRKPVLSRSPLVNMPLVWAAIGSAIATLLIIYTPLSGFFETTPVGLKNWIMIGGLCLAISAVYDIAKLIKPSSEHA